MIESLDGDSFFAELLMMRQVDERLVLIVEGPEDVGLLDPHIDMEVCRTEIAHGKSNALRAADLLQRRAMEGFLTIVDRDFASPEEVAEWNGRVYASVNYDTTGDVLSLSPEIIERVLANHADRVISRNYLKSVEMRILELLVHYVAPLGALRKVSVEQDLGIKLRAFPVHTLVSASELGAVVRETVALAVKRNPERALDASTVEDLVVEQLNATAGSEITLCSAHDLISALAALIKVRLGGGVSVNGADHLARTIRSAFACDNLKLLPLFAVVQEWGLQSDSTVWTCAA